MALHGGGGIVAAASARQRALASVSSSPATSGSVPRGNASKKKSSVINNHRKPISVSSMKNVGKQSVAAAAIGGNHQSIMAKRKRKMAIENRNNQSISRRWRRRSLTVIAGSRHLALACFFHLQH